MPPLHPIIIVICPLVMGLFYVDKFVSYCTFGHIKLFKLLKYILPKDEEI